METVDANECIVVYHTVRIMKYTKNPSLVIESFSSQCSYKSDWGKGLWETRGRSHVETFGYERIVELEIVAIRHPNHSC